MPEVCQGVGGPGGGGGVNSGFSPRSCICLKPELMYALAMSTPMELMPALVWGEGRGQASEGAGE